MASAKVIELDDTNTCKLCENALAKYVCPKCNVLYCSLNCYQSEKHSSCSEEFYKDNIYEELKLNENDPTSKTKMMEILKKVHENNPLINEMLEDDGGDNTEALDSDDDQEFADIADRLANVDLDDAEQVWQKLNEDERKEFAAFLQSEEVSKLIPSWNPWWSFYNDSKVQEIGEKTESYKSKCPTLVDIENFQNICKKEPAETVEYNLINILAGYALTTRYFNGEFMDFPKEAASCMGSISSSLKSHQDFNSLDTAIESVEQECTNSEWIMTDAENLGTMRADLEKILKGPNRTETKYYILCALSDLHCLLKKGLVKKENTNSTFAKSFPNVYFPEVKMHSSYKIKLYLKRVEFFLSFVHNFYNK